MNTESKTPRTDTELVGANWPGVSGAIKFARQLETELNEAKTQLDGGGIHSCGPKCQRVECVLRRKLSALKSAADGLAAKAEACAAMLEEVRTGEDFEVQCHNIANEATEAIATYLQICQ